MALISAAIALVSSEESWSDVIEASATFSDSSSLTSPGGRGPVDTTLPLSPPGGRVKQTQVITRYTVKTSAYSRFTLIPWVRATFQMYSGFA
jgi:hypothetical protein